MTAHLLIVVLVVCVMVKARDFKLGSMPCVFCGRRGLHAPTCPARGA